jgi:hypothetical protein
MDSIFVFNKTNFEFLKEPTLEACLTRIGNAPYWRVQNRVCWHYGEPQFIIHNNYVVEALPDKYKDYFHVTNPKKPLYAITHYSAGELKSMARQLSILDTGTRIELYARIAETITYMV